MSTTNCVNPNPCGCKIVFHPSNAATIYLFGLVAIVTGSDPPTTEPVPNATLEATLLDNQGADVPGLIDIPLAPIGSPPNGDYAGQVTGQSFDPDEGGDYTLIVEGTNGPDEIYVQIDAGVINRRHGGLPLVV